MSRGILDTSTLILLGRLRDTDTLPDEPLITAITLAELSVGPLVASTDQERGARQAHLHHGGVHIPADHEHQFRSFRCAGHF